MKSLVLLSVLAVFFAYASAEEGLTNCQAHKRGATSPGQGGVAFKIECDERGMYRPMQCTADNVSPKWCACYSPERQVSRMSKNVQRCECHMAKGRLEDAGKTGCDLPQCAPDGTFKLVQTPCPPAKRHCAHPHTGVKTSELPEGGSCPTAP